VEADREHGDTLIMPHRHTIAPGDCLSSVAYDEGFHPETLWDAPENAELRRQRDSYNVLLPGDVVFVPDRRERLEHCVTARRHRFRRRGVPERFRLALLAFGEPRANLAFVLEIDGRETRGTTDANGRIDVPIPPNARRGVLRIGERERYDLDLGRVAPVSAEIGVRTRLANLAYLEREDGDAAALRDAVRAFQRAQSLDPTGVVDDATRRALVEAHGS
jgi:N-acetylmuramoyl-L-alanine amidase